jgi:hypothetical protein
MIAWFQDLRYALRQLRKSPGFTLAAVLTLAMAIGANAVVFSVLNGLILRPLNVPQAESLYGIERASDKDMDMTQSYPDYLDLRERNRSFEDLAAFSVPQVALDTGENPSLAWGMEASGNYFDALQIQPYIGRLFHASDEPARAQAELCSSPRKINHRIPSRRRTSYAQKTEFPGVRLVISASGRRSRRYSAGS